MASIATSIATRDACKRYLPSLVASVLLSLVTTRNGRPPLGFSFKISEPMKFVSGPFSNDHCFGMLFYPIKMLYFGQRGILANQKIKSQNQNGSERSSIAVPNNQSEAGRQAGCSIAVVQSGLMCIKSKCTR